MGAAGTKDDDARRNALSDLEEMRLLARLRGTELEWVPTEGDGWWSQHASLMHIQACVVPVEESLLVAQKFIEALELDPQQQFFTPQRQVELGLEMFRSRHDQPNPLARHLDRLPAQWRDDARLRVLLQYYGYVAHTVCDTIVRLLACVRTGYSPLPTTTLLDQMRVIVRDIPLPYPLGHILLTEALTLSRLARRQHGNPDELVLVLAAWHWTPLEAHAFGPAFRNVSRDADPMNAAFDFGGVPDDDTMAARPPEHLDLILVELAKDARRRVPLPEEHRSNEDNVWHMPAPPSPEQESMTLAQWATHWLKLGGQRLANVGTKLAIDINDKMLVHLGLVFLAFHCLPRASASFDTDNWLGWTNRTDVDLTDFFPNGPSPAQFAAWPGLREKLENDLGHGPGGARDMMYTGEVNCVWSPDGLEKHAYDEVAVYCTHVARVAFLSVAGAMTPHFCAQNSRDIAIFVTSMLDEVKKQIPGAVLALRSKLISDGSYEGWKKHLRNPVKRGDNGKPLLYQHDAPGVVYENDARTPHQNEYYFNERTQRMQRDPPDERYLRYSKEPRAGLPRGTSSTVAPNTLLDGVSTRQQYQWSNGAHQYVSAEDDRAHLEREQAAVERKYDDRLARDAKEVENFAERAGFVREIENELRGLQYEAMNYQDQNDPRLTALYAKQRRVKEQLEHAREHARDSVRSAHIRRDKAEAAKPKEWIGALRDHMREPEDMRQARMRAVRARRPPSPPPRPPRGTPGAEAGAGPAPVEPPASNNGWFSFWF